MIELKEAVFGFFTGAFTGGSLFVFYVLPFTRHRDVMYKLESLETKLKTTTKTTRRIVPNALKLLKKMK